MTRGRPPAAPKERTETVREAIRRILTQGSATAKELSGAVGIREKDVEEHLEHLEKTLRHEGQHLGVEPANCLSCGYVFADRKRYSRPSACPKCRETHIDPPIYGIDAPE